MQMYSQYSTLVGGCGVNVLHNFSQNPHYSYFIKNQQLQRLLEDGAGLTIANFVDTEYCKNMYKELTSSYSILYQSPLRLNRRSGRQGFLVVFDTSTKKGS